MRKCLFGLLASTALVFGACQGATSPSPSASTAPPASAPASSAAASESPSPSGSADITTLLYGANYQPEQGKTGGSVVIGEWQAANQLNYYFSNAFANSEVYAATTRSLLRVTADGHWQADLSADKITFDGNVTKDSSGTGFTVNAKLLPNLKWSDGEPLTMNDYKFTWSWVNDPKQTGITPGGWDKVDKVDVVSDTEANFHFKEAFAGWLGTIGGNPVLPQHYLSKLDIKNANKSYPMSAAIAQVPVSGPFKYVTASPTAIELARNDNWAGPASACAPKACLDKVTYQFFPDNKAGMEAAFKNGDIDVALDLLQGDYDAIKDVDPSTGKAILNPGWSYEHLDMNQAGLGSGKGDPALKDIKVRQAMAMAIDQTALWHTIFPGAPDPAVQACTNATPTNYWYLPGAETKCLKFDVAAANAALDSAGYTKNADGTRNGKDGKPITFEHCTSNVPVRQTSAEFLKKAFQAIGITLNLNFVDSTAVLFAGWGDVSADTKCNLAHGNYDTSEFAYVLSFDLFGDYYYSYATEQIPTDKNKGNGYNYLRLSNPDMDAAIKVLQNAIDPKEQVDAALKIQDVYIAQTPEIPLYFRNDVRGYSTKLHNFFYNPGTNSDMWNIEDWWVDQ
jgi:peptide/nickel transport system substrate-binding protein